MERQREENEGSKKREREREKKQSWAGIRSVLWCEDLTGSCPPNPAP